MFFYGVEWCVEILWGEELVFDFELCIFVWMYVEVRDMFFGKFVWVLLKGLILMIEVELCDGVCFEWCFLLSVGWIGFLVLLSVEVILYFRVLVCNCWNGWLWC